MRVRVPILLARRFYEKIEPIVSGIVLKARFGTLARKFDRRPSFDEKKPLGWNGRGIGRRNRRRKRGRVRRRRPCRAEVAGSRRRVEAMEGSSRTAWRRHVLVENAPPGSGTAGRESDVFRRLRNDVAVVESKLAGTRRKRCGGTPHHGRSSRVSACRLRRRRRTRTKSRGEKRKRNRAHSIAVSRAPITRLREPTNA
jgi:hypothetical protein